MADEPKLAQTLEAKFPAPRRQDHRSRARAGCSSRRPPRASARSSAYLKKEQGFFHCCTITRDSTTRTRSRALYHLADRARDGAEPASCACRATRRSCGSVTDLYPGCANYERELVDLLGLHSAGLPPGNRYPMPDDFPAGTSTPFARTGSRAAK